MESGKRGLSEKGKREEGRRRKKRESRLWLGAKTTTNANSPHRGRREVSGQQREDT